jgi:hypothetical protein
VIFGQKELISLVCFLENKMRINLVILIFRGNKDEDPEIFLKKYKELVLVRGLKHLQNCLIFFLNS